jgi:ribosomal protein S18 acetylase RimI-like enzyme
LWQIMNASLPPLAIRPARLADAAALSALLVRTFAETFGPYTAPDDLGAYFAEKFRPNLQAAEIANVLGDTDIFVAEVPTAQGGTELIGCVYVVQSKPPDCIRGPDPIELKRLYVDSSWHGRGVAPALMTEAFRAARARGGRTMWLTVYEHNGRAQSFYRRYGFERKGEAIFPVGSDPQVDWLLERSLDGWDQ